MEANRAATTVLLALAALCAVRSASAQQIVNQAPLARSGDSFYESYNFTWRYRGRGFFFNGPGPAPPPFGGFAGGGGTFGFQRGPFSFGFSAAQGSNRTFISETPSLTVTNGYGGVIRSGVVRPFVVGLVPVVGEAPRVGVRDPAVLRLQASEPSANPPRNSEDAGPPLRERPDSAGGQSLAELRAARAARASEDRRRARAEAERWLALAEKAERRGKLETARHFRQLASRAAADADR